MPFWLGWISWLTLNEILLRIFVVFTNFTCDFVLIGIFDYVMNLWYIGI